MELTRRKIKKVTNEKIMEETNVIEYKIGDILKYYIKCGDKIQVNYGHLVTIVNRDIYKVSNIKNNIIHKVDRKDVVKKIDDSLYFDSISSIYNLLFHFLILQIVMFLCYYLYTFHNKDFIIMTNNLNIFIKNAIPQLIIYKNIVIHNCNIFIKNASTQIIVHKDKIIKFFNKNETIII